MVTQQTRPRRRDTYTRSGMAAAAALLLGLGGCNPIDTYRHWTGISANDPNPATTPNTGNLAAGEAKSYPNLATVPPPPTQALTTAELNKLTQSLIADRANAKYTSEQLQAKFDEAAAPPPPPPPPPAAPAAGETKPASVTLGAAGAAAPAVAPAPGNTPAHQAPPAANPAPGSSASAGNGEKGAPRAGQPPEPGPMESPLQSPQIAALPQPEQSRPAPPPPRLLSAPSGPAIGTAPGAHLPAPPARPPVPAAIGSGQPQAAPAPPSLPPPAAVQTATAVASPRPAKTPAPPAAFVSLASVTFPADATAVTEADRQTLARIVARYRQTPGLLKVVGHANVGSTAAQQLDSYRVALDRAQAVADALRKAGIPANKLQVEAAPTSGDAAAQGRADILLAQ